MTAFGTLDVAIRAMRQGAFEYLVKPFDLDGAGKVINRALERRRTSEASATEPCPEILLGKSPAMQQVFKRIALVAGADCPVLITGESGTGKELVASAIHQHSSRHERPFVPVHLAALSPNLVESELFGHARGAFTGADAARQGLLELARGGTVFFDEAGDIPIGVQVKLLRVLEQGQVTPVGDSQPRDVTFRVVAATHRRLAEVGDDVFRRDLYYRFAVFEIHLPPLRERREDIPLLCEAFLRSAARSPQAGITDEALRELCARPWVGNVRELRNAIEHGLVMSRGGMIGLEHLPPPTPQHGSPAQDSKAHLDAAIRSWTSDQLAAGNQANLHEQFLASAEPTLFEAILATTNGNRAKASEVLGLHRATLRKKLK